ncbi:MAG: hypothetical protein EPO26_06555 [Chloroflexota bacterium]|nr:MAG: hypothetical protein EPO26_06555 [Chloroflexota bacterium]
MKRLRYAPKLPIARIRRLYQADALRLRDDDLLTDVGWRLVARCADVLMVSASQARCPECHACFRVPWIGQPPSLVSTCPPCGWSVTAGEYHDSWRHQDLWGTNAREPLGAFVATYSQAASYEARMLLIDRLINAVHTTGGRVARNLFEGRSSQVIAALDALAVDCSQAPRDG